MNLDNLFEMQEVLDNRIYDRFPDLKDQDNLDWKILALQVELGELANEWRGFKKWSEDQEPRGYNIYVEGNGVEWKNPLLEEYVDCLHFILSIGNDIGIKLKGELPSSLVNYTTLDSFNNIFYYVARFSELKTSLLYKNFLITFVHLGKRLGFTWEQIEQAYLDKNKINHERQENGY